MSLCRARTWQAVLCGALVQCVASVPVGISAAQQPSDSDRPVVVTRLVAEREPRRNDGRLLFLLTNTIIQRAQPGRGVYDGRGPGRAVWVGGTYRREADGGRWRFEMFAYSAGEFRTTVALGRPAEALEQSLCTLRILTCGVP